MPWCRKESSRSLSWQKERETYLLQSECADIPSTNIQCEKYRFIQNYIQTRHVKLMRTCISASLSPPFIRRSRKRIEERQHRYIRTNRPNSSSLIKHCYIRQYLFSVITRMLLLNRQSSVIQVELQVGYVLRYYVDQFREVLLIYVRQYRILQQIIFRCIEH